MSDRNRLLGDLLSAGGVGNSPAGVCVAWMERADRRCGRPSGDTWLCPRHERIAHRRLDALAERIERDRAASARRRAERESRIREELARIERRIDAIDPLFKGPRDNAVVNLPRSQRLPSDARIAELAELHQRAQRLRSQL